MNINIYAIWFPTSERLNPYYIGVTNNLSKRMLSHLDSKQLVGKALRKYDDWIIKKLYSCKTYEEAYKLEIKEIKSHDCIAPNGYNQTSGGEGGDYWRNKKNPVISKSNRERIWSEESRRKVGDGSRGHKLSKDAREKCRQAQLGDRNSAKNPGVGAKISKAKKGKSLSKEHIAKIKKNNKGMKGKHHSEISKIKMAISHYLYHIKRLEKELKK